MSYKTYSGTGTLYLAPVDSDGVKTGNFRQVGDAYPLTVQVTTKQTKVKSRMVERAGQIIASKVEIDEIGGALTLREWNAANLAWALSGEAVALTAIGGSVTDESIEAPPAEEYIALAHRDISSVVVTSDPAGTTYVNGTDYVYDAKLGLFTPVAGGALAAGGADLLVDYSYAAKSGYQVNIGSKVQIRVAILGHLWDEYRMRDYEIELDSVVLAASQEINFISEEGSEGELLQFGMVLETLSGQSSPGRINGVPM